MRARQRHRTALLALSFFIAAACAGDVPCGLYATNNAKQEDEQTTHKGGFVCEPMTTATAGTPTPTATP
ncbi:MAG TPA: hypothetical protein VEA38_11175 [Terriglobales bacterium]|nr:hypothetical protein [Terriglobales bacterium]